MVAGAEAAVAHTPSAEIAGQLAALAAGDAAARVAALDWLASHAPDALTAAHASLFADPALAVRATAAVLLRASPDPTLVNGARRALRDLIMGDRPARHAGLRAAARLASPFLAPRLLAFLNHPDAETRRLALLALAAPPPGLVAPALLISAALPLRDDLEPEVRAAAEALLADLDRHAAARLDQAR